MIGSALCAALRAAARGEATAPLPREAYTHGELFEIERERFLRASWRAAAGEGDVASVGEWLRVGEERERMMLVRGSDLAVRARYDVCRHRGFPLLRASSGRATRQCFECPYHRWKYALDGALLDAPGAPEGFDRASAGLIEAQCTRALHQWWVSDRMDKIQEIVGPEWLSVRAPLVRARSKQWEVAANWKLVVENFQESHHFASVHPALERCTPWKRSYSETHDARWLGGVMPLADGVETASMSGGLGGRPLIGDAKAVRDAYVFPNALYSLQPDYLLVYRFVAEAIDRTVMRCDLLVHGSCDVKDPSLDDVYALWDSTEAQDRVVCEAQQRALRSPGFSPAVYATSEDGVAAFHRALCAAIAPALPSEAS